jgi:thymidine phosphorylase
VVDLDPHALGEAVVQLGGGRRRTEDEIDPAVGIHLLKRRGDRAAKGEPLARILAGEEAAARKVAKEQVLPAYRIEEASAGMPPLVRRLVTAGGDWEWRGAETWKEVRLR